MLNSILTSTTSSIDLVQVLICTLSALVCGFIIALVHKGTSKYNKNFLVTITMLPVLVMSVIMLVNGNLGMGVAVAGTFSLVRFRSIPGTSKEIMIVFFAMAIGLACGMGYVAFAGLITIISSIVIIFLSTVSLFNNNSNEKYLRITIPEDLDYSGVFDEVLNKYASKYHLEQVKTTNLGSMFELKYCITLNDNVNEKVLLDEIRIRNGNLKIVLSDDLINDNL